MNKCEMMWSHSYRLKINNYRINQIRNGDSTLMHIWNLFHKIIKNEVDFIRVELKNMYIKYSHLANIMMMCHI